MEHGKIASSKQPTTVLTSPRSSAHASKPWSTQARPPLHLLRASYWTMKINSLHMLSTSARQLACGVRWVANRLHTGWKHIHNLYRVIHRLINTPPVDLLARGTVYVTVEQKFYYFCWMHSSFSPLSRWRVHPLTL